MELNSKIVAPMTAWTLAGSALLALLVGFAQSQDPAAKDAAAQRVEVLEKDLISTRQRAEELALQLGETRALLEQVVQYIKQQADGSKELAKTLDASEEAGFTFGINPESRHILLQGWRAQLATVQKDLPLFKASAAVVEKESKPLAR